MMSSLATAQPFISFIVAIIEMAIRDATCFRKPRKYRQLYYADAEKVRAIELRAASARDFLSKENKKFKHYCGLLGLDPEWVAKKAWIIINEFDESDKRKVSYLRGQK
jgi:hypothetical protein